MGYELGKKAYRLFNPDTQSVIISSNVQFMQLPWLLTVSQAPETLRRRRGATF